MHSYWEYSKGYTGSHINKDMLEPSSSSSIVILPSTVSSNTPEERQIQKPNKESTFSIGKNLKKGRAIKSTYLGLNSFQASTTLRTQRSIITISLPYPSRKSSGGGAELISEAEAVRL